MSRAPAGFLQAEGLQINQPRVSEGRAHPGSFVSLQINPEGVASWSRAAWTLTGFDLFLLRYPG